MTPPRPIYAGFLGTWILVPESCNYEQGPPPQQAQYHISEREGRVSFRVDRVDADGAAHQVSFSGFPDGQPVPFAGGDLADALAISAPSPRVLNSSAFRQGVELMLAERQLDETKTAMRVVQQVRLPDGSRPTNISVYRKQTPHESLN